MGVRNLDGRPFLIFCFWQIFGAKVKEYRSVKFFQFNERALFYVPRGLFIASGVVGDFEDAPSERLCYFDYERSVLSQRSRKNSGRK